MADAQVKVWAGQLAVGDNVITIAGLGEVKGIHVNAIRETNANNAVSTGRIRVSKGYATPARQFATVALFDYVTSSMIDGWGTSLSGVIASISVSGTTATVTTDATVTNWGVDTITINCSTGSFAFITLFGGADAKAEIMDSNLSATLVNLVNTQNFRPTLTYSTWSNSNQNNVGVAGAAWIGEGFTFTDLRGDMRAMNTSLIIDAGGTAPIITTVISATQYWRSGSSISYRITSINSNGVTVARDSIPPGASRCFFLMVELPGWDLDIGLDMIYATRDIVNYGAYELGQPDVMLMLCVLSNGLDYGGAGPNSWSRGSLCIGGADGERCGSVALSTNPDGSGSSVSTHCTGGRSNGIAVLDTGSSICARFNPPVFRADGFTLPRLESDGQASETSRMMTLLMRKVA